MPKLSEMPKRVHLSKLLKLLEITKYDIGKMVDLNAIYTILRDISREEYYVNAGKWREVNIAWGVRKKHKAIIHIDVGVPICQRVGQTMVVTLDSEADTDTLIQYFLLDNKTVPVSISGQVDHAISLFRVARKVDNKKGIM